MLRRSGIIFTPDDRRSLGKSCDDANNYMLAKLSVFADTRRKASTIKPLLYCTITVNCKNKLPSVSKHVTTSKRRSVSAAAFLEPSDTNLASIALH